MSLQSYVNNFLLKISHTNSDIRLEKVLVLTSDSRTLVGNLLSCDQMTNLVLSDTIERIIRPPEDPEPSSEVSHGLYLVRGDNVVCVGLVVHELDDSINWNEVRGAIIGGIKHL
ncbi:U6 snRNA-associated Sm-like protein LSm8 [Golovinomyces cichoracearum]|uniref:LSM2-LSM8 complex subunit LSM8 n=1 Tax=Golovinomyces cichoracearum TaxID=62708 RepID=A0A420IG90_9PEZI|nr:U6 snRNA-associated Sm-like protein LSm8 [Golovinomyces cichoracearum]